MAENARSLIEPERETDHGGISGGGRGDDSNVCSQWLMSSLFLVVVDDHPCCRFVPARAPGRASSMIDRERAFSPVFCPRWNRVLADNKSPTGYLNY